MLNIHIYTYHSQRDYTDLYGPNGTISESNVGLAGSFSFMAGTNYNITETFSAFTEIGYGPVICKIGTRIGWFPN